MVTLYRGITVKPELHNAVRTTIRASGMTGREGSWTNIEMPVDIGIVQGAVGEYLAGPSSFHAVFEHETQVAGVFASGDQDCAIYYATQHNFSESAGHTMPLVIRFDAEFSNMFVDGRDFLITAFQLCDQRGAADRCNQRDVLSSLFGERILRYFDRSCQTQDQKTRVALARIACFDPQVVEAHFHNKRTLAGRYRTKFASAFVVAAPVKPDNIQSVEFVPLANHDRRAYTLDSFLAGDPF
jgi:hypothetical protein